MENKNNSLKNKENFSLIDIGGTYTKVQILSFFKGKKRILFEKIEKINSKIELFNFLKGLEEFSPLKISVFSIAGPVFENTCILTNWKGKQEIKLSELKKQLNFKDGYILNDMEAQGYGLIQIKSNKFKDKEIKKLYLAKKIKKNGNMALIVTGTGLGSCGIIEGKTVLPIELQHSSFYPRDEKVRVFFEKLIKNGMVPSYENFVSGAGLLSIYSILKNQKKLINDPDILKTKALKGDKFAQKTFEIYFYVLSLYCQAIALTFKPLGGIYIGGKAVEKNIDLLDKKKFIKNFKDNPKQASFLEKIPIFLIKKNLIFDGLFYFLKKKICDKIIEN